jgi:hypothetical protein
MKSMPMPRGPHLQLLFHGTVIGTAQGVTLQELRIECFFPANASTAEASRQVARAE